MKPLVLLCTLLGIARAAGGSIESRDVQSGERKSDFFNNGIANPFPVAPMKSEQQQQQINNPFESLLEISDNQQLQQRYTTLAFINVSWFEGNNDEIKFHMETQERAKYGMGKVLDVDGRLVHVTDAYNEEDHSACNTSLRDSNKHPLNDVSKPWIALIKRGGCDFEKKIFNVFELGASGAIIYNNISDKELNFMKITKKELLEGNITSVFTTMSKGLMLAEKIQKHEHVFVAIRVGRQFDRNTTNFGHRSSVLFVTISFIIVMVISMLWLIVYYYQRFRYLQTKENERKMDSNKAKEALKKIPTKQIKQLSKVSVCFSFEGAFYLFRMVEMGKCVLISWKKTTLFFFISPDTRNWRATAVLCVSKPTKSMMC